MTPPNRNNAVLSVLLAIAIAVASAVTLIFGPGGLAP